MKVVDAYTLPNYKSSLPVNVVLNGTDPAQCTVEVLSGGYGLCEQLHSVQYNETRLCSQTALDAGVHLNVDHWSLGLL